MALLRACRAGFFFAGNFSGVRRLQLLSTSTPLALFLFSIELRSFGLITLALLQGELFVRTNSFNSECSLLGSSVILSDCVLFLNWALVFGLRMVLGSSKGDSLVGVVSSEVFSFVHRSWHSLANPFSAASSSENLPGTKTLSALLSLCTSLTPSSATFAPRKSASALAISF
eukprot:TRINITY_DN1942_c0_g1_i7.p1 TRINITY_DN1942_c0_g1~~TRINITY_DN1942_c0_g1_i7.p1  ORF type:complete len:172 (-),score=0.06 TRINITY_DN1942_c0_g1_i7:370-885(-)